VSFFYKILLNCRRKEVKLKSEVNPNYFGRKTNFAPNSLSTNTQAKLSGSLKEVLKDSTLSSKMMFFTTNSSSVEAWMDQAPPVFSFSTMGRPIETSCWCATNIGYEETSW